MFPASSLVILPPDQFWNPRYSGFVSSNSFASISKSKYDNDKYIIYVVPIVILLISFSISSLQNLKVKVSIIIFLLILSFSNLLIKNIKREIDKPEFTKILLDLNKQNDSRYYTVSFADHSKPLFNKVVNNLIQQIIYKKKINLEQVSQNKDYWIICYDPSNTYDYCTKKNILLNA